jgi:hypothetical protein
MITKSPIDVTDIYPIISHRKFEKRNFQKIKFLMIHHTGSRNLSLKELYDLHTKDMHKWPTIGYHFYVTKNNILYQTNVITTIVNGCKNHNTNTVHLCFEGDYTKEIAPYYLKENIDAVLKYLDHFKVKPEIILHSDKKNTLCPGHNLKNEIMKLFKKSNVKDGLIWPELEN